MRKYLVAASILLLASCAHAEDSIKISELPTGVGSDIASDDVVPYVDTSTSITKKVRFDQFVNIPALITAFGTPTLANTLLNGNSAGTSNLDMNSKQLLRVRLENLSVDPSPGSAGRVFWHTTLGQLRLDTGSAIVAVGGASRTVQGSWGSPMVLTPSVGITAANARFQVVYIAGSGPVDLSALNPQVSAGFSDGDEMAIIATSSVNTVRFGDGNGLQINDEWNMGAGSNCNLIWVQGSSKWLQKGWCNDL